MSASHLPGVPPPPLVTTGRPSVLARRHAISTTHQAATEAGHRVFLAGGSAIDAGIAAGLALNVVEPHLSNLLGVAPILLQPAGGDPVAIDGLGRWPAAWDRAEVLRRFGGDLPVGVPRMVTPGAIDAWLSCLARFGSRSLAQVAEPAIELAEGFPVSRRLASYLAAERATIAAWPTTAAVFLPGGRTPEEGDVLVQSDLASFLRRLVALEADHSQRGRAAAILAVREDMFTGGIGHELADFLAAAGSGLTARDLAQARLTIEPPLRGHYRGREVLACGPWSQGVVVPLALQLLEGIDLAGAAEADRLHVITEALKLAFADREGFLGDPEQVEVPVEGLLAPSYAAQRRALLDHRLAAPSLPPPGDPWPHQGRQGPAGYRPEPTEGEGGPDTTFVAAMDAAGNAFAATPSDPALLGPVVPGLGATVSTRGSMLWLDADHPSVVAPGKRPRLTCNPGLVRHAGRPVLAYGCPGADAQCQAMVQVVVNLLDRGMGVQEAIEAPRIVTTSVPSSIFPHAWQPGGLAIESRVAGDVQEELAARGHRVEPLPAFAPQAAGVSAVRRLPNGVLEAGADPRREGSALGR